MSVDPTKSDFDPLLALYSVDVKDTPEGVTVYDNLATFESSVQMQKYGVTNEPGTSKKRDKSFSKKKRVIEEAKNRDLGKLKELMSIRQQLDESQSSGSDASTSRRKKAPMPRHMKPRRTLLTSMERLNKGPYSVVYKIAKAHLKCCVYTRDFCGLRGVCTGYVVAFDRYLNLALVDVDETFRKPPVGEVASHQKSLSVSELNGAMRKCSIGQKTKVTMCGSSHETRRPKSDRARSDTSKNDTVSDEQHIVRIVGTRLFKSEVFHGGEPQLYHRHVGQLLVRGDSIVMVTEYKQVNTG